MYDIIIIGGGPAGLTAAIYAKRAGYTALILEGGAPGGQAATTPEIENWPGIKNVAGSDFSMNLYEQSRALGAEMKFEGVTGLADGGRVKSVTTLSGVYDGRAVIIANGVRRRKLEVPGEERLAGRGMSYCATCDGNFFRDKTVMVVGGGNTAAGDAISLSRICKKVYLVHRRDKLRATAIYHKRLEDLPNLEFVWNAVPRKLVADEGALAGVRVEMLETGEERDIAVDGLFVAVGTEPNTEFLAGALTTDETGYIVAGESGETEVPGVYVAGDVRTKFLRQVVTAVADGALCAEEAAEYLAI